MENEILCVAISQLNSTPLISYLLQILFIGVERTLATVYASQYHRKRFNYCGYILVAAAVGFALLHKYLLPVFLCIICNACHSGVLLKRLYVIVSNIDAERFARDGQSVLYRVAWSVCESLRCEA